LRHPNRERSEVRRNFFARAAERSPCVLVEIRIGEDPDRQSNQPFL